MELDKVAILVKKASLEFDKLSNPYFAKYDLTSSQYKVLKYLYAVPERRARIIDLEKNYSMTHPTALGLVAALEEKGFTSRVDNPDDARGKYIVLTKKADDLQDELEKLGDSIEDKLTENLTKKEKEQIIYLLNKLIRMEA